MKTRFLLFFLLLSVLASAQTYTESILYSFNSSSSQGEGAYPVGGVVLDKFGNLYGTTSQGGTYNSNCTSEGMETGCGTIFKLTSTGVETLLHKFTGGSDGASPLSSLAIDKSGNLYGTTVYGGLGCGTAFKVTPAGKYSILHKFSGVGKGDGCYPYGPLTLDSLGNMYGATNEGGTSRGECGTNGLTGCGTVFEMSATGKVTILYEFTFAGASFPLGNVLRDNKGNIYGLANNVLFELTPKKVLVTLYDLNGAGLSGDGTANAYTARNAAGNFFGVALQSSGFNWGLWEVTSSGIETTYYFCESCNILSPSGNGFDGPLMFSGGNLYGTAYSGGPAASGVVYEFSPTTGIETVLYTFDGVDSPTDGCGPQGGVIADSAGNLYGTTLFCGSVGSGTVFKLIKN